MTKSFLFLKFVSHMIQKKLMGDAISAFSYLSIHDIY
jgi:hypothetical protein